jgi:hypothetical protein
MKGKYFVLIVVLFCAISCSKNNSNSAQDVGHAQAQDLYTEQEIKTLPREELMMDAGKTFYIISDVPPGEFCRKTSVPLGEFCRKAVVFTEGDEGVTVYLSIDGSIIRDRLGTILIDGSKYGGTFYAWKIAKYKETNVGFLIYCYWGKSDLESSTTDPLSMEYDMERDLIYIWHIDPKDL